MPGPWAALDGPSGPYIRPGGSTGGGRGGKQESAVERGGRWEVGASVVAAMTTGRDGRRGAGGP